MNSKHIQRLTVNMIEQQAIQKPAQKSRNELLEMLKLANKGEAQDFSYQDLTGIQKLSNFQCLVHCNFSYADMENADLRGVNLGNANLSYANLRFANLYDGYLDNANLSCANLSGSKITVNYLESTNLTGANLINANFGESIIKETCTWDGAILNGAFYGMYEKLGKHDEKIYMTKPPLIFSAKDHEYDNRELFAVIFFDHFIKIGCQIRSYKEWLAMKEDEIVTLGGFSATTLNRLHRDEIIKMAIAHGCNQA
ncbi:MAG TPA: pentapeptide repeat-containing protein [Phormidium sp.]